MSSIESMIHRSYEIATERRHELVTVEHLLAALLDDIEITTIITGVGGDLEHLKNNLGEFLNDLSLPTIHSSYGEYRPRHTELLMAVVKKAKAQGLFSQRKDAAIDLLLSMFNNEHSHASYFLFKSGVDRDAVIQYISKKPIQSNKMTEKEALEILNAFCVNLNEKAKAGKIDPLIGRDAEVEELVQITARRNKNNVVMVGDPGVGKTQIVEGLAKRIVDGEVPEILKNKVIWSMDMGSMVAGTKFRGDFEERLKQVVAALASLDYVFTFIDEIHTMLGAGSGGQGALDASNLLKPALSRGELRCIGSTTLEEYRKYFEKDRALNRRFQKLSIDEPSIEDTKKILFGLLPHYERFHGVKYSSEAINLAVELSVKYIKNRCLPDKAIDIIDAAGARQRVKPLTEKVNEIGIEQIIIEVSKIAKVPVDASQEDDKQKLAQFEPEMKKVIFGQDPAIDSIATAIYISRAGLREATKTLGAYLFTGPTGSGKTEVARQLANIMGINLIRFDMSEFQEKHTVSKFIGSPAGYVGYGDGAAGDGLLTNAIDTHPHSVLLLDEVEKAHPDILNILLQVMDHGTLTNQSGKEVNFRNVILILTSNLGAAEMEKEVIGFGAASKGGEDKAAVSSFFSPEFRNRLDATIPFSKLTKDIMYKVLDKFLNELNILTSAKKVNVVPDTLAKEWLIKHGFDSKMGARPLARIITEHIKKPLSREILFGKLIDGGNVVFTVKDDNLVYDISETPLHENELIFDETKGLMDDRTADISVN